jgi:phage shock protein C
MSPELLDTLAGYARRLYVDRDNGVFFGVCAGLADSFGWPLLTVRIVAVCALLFLFVPTAVLYVTAGLLLPRRRLTYHGEAERRFWQAAGRGRRPHRGYCA